MKSILSAFLLSGFLVACDGDQPVLFSYSEPNDHPKSENYPLAAYEVGRGDWIGRMARKPEDRFSTPELPLSKLSGVEYRVSSYGADEGILFSYARDAAFLDPYIIALDGVQSSVTAINTETGEVEIVGPAGMGPLEFQSPVAVEVMNEKSVLVFSALGKMNQISRVSGSWIEVNDIDLGFQPISACRFGDHLVVLGPPEPEGEMHIIRVLTLDGQLVRSFGEAYQTELRLMRIAMSSGAGLACFPERNSIVIAYKFMPIIASYSIEGELQWVSYLDDFTPRRKIDMVSSSGSHGVAHPLPVAGEDWIEGIQRIEGTNEFMIQVGEAVEDPPSGLNLAVEWLTMSVKDGKVIGRDVGPIVWHAARDRFIAYTEFPEPVVHLVERK